jgi:tRNA dimethylallyltransferase
MRNRILVICGPTSTGKTSLALDLAKIFKGDLISADSRQVYKNLDIGTGKDVPKEFKFVKDSVSFKGKSIGYYSDGRTKIWGYDLVSPKENIDVATYIRLARKIVKKIQSKKRLPIVVGGTGFYIKGLLQGIKTASIPRDDSLRKGLEVKEAGELFEILAQLDPIKAASLNESDRKNQRRLVRAIEISTSKLKKNKDEKDVEKPMVADILYIGLTASKKSLFKRVDIRVDQRVKQGIVDEIVKILKSGVDWEDQSMSSLGYRQWKDYFNKDKSIEEVIKRWKVDEHKYVNRQIVWFKRNKKIQWFDVTKPSYKQSVEELVRKWYKSD